MAQEFQKLASYLRDKRISSKLTQLELSKKLKVHVQFVSNWERGTCAPPSRCFESLIKVLEINREKLVHVMVSDAKASIENKVLLKTKKA